MTRRRHWTVPVVITALLAGCADSTPVIDQEPVDESVQPQRAQAREALDRYAAAIEAAGGAPKFIPVGETTGVTGPFDDDNAERAVAAGKVTAGGKLPSAPAQTGKVAWADGTSHTLPLLSATQVIDEMAMTSYHHDCDDCRPVEATRARFTTMTVPTTRGEAKVPAWEFTLRSGGARITRPAIARTASVKITPPSWDPYNTPGGLAIVSATTVEGSREMTVGFTGSPGPGSQPCGADYTTEAVESADAVVVIVITHPHAPAENCESIGAARTAPVRLLDPLGERAVLEVQQGLPVPVTITR
jgi:hypothetical protein